MPVTAEQFRRALAHVPAGVTIVTSRDADGSPVGATVSAFSPLSLHPPLILVSLTRESRTTAAIRASRAFVVHLPASEQAPLAMRFATSHLEKFDGVAHTPNHYGAPCLDGCPVRLECTLDAEHPGGDHIILVGLVEQTHIGEGEGFNPLMYFRRSFRLVGREVPAA